MSFSKVFNLIFVVFYFASCHISPLCPSVMALPEGFLPPPLCQLRYYSGPAVSQGFVLA